MLSENCYLEKGLLSDVRFFEEKVHSLSVAPSLLLFGTKSWRVLSLICSRNWNLPLLQPLSIYPGSLKKELGCIVLAYSLVVCRLSGAVVWSWLRVNVAYSRVVPCWHILPNMLVFEYCSFSPESSIIESCLFTVSFVRLVSLVLLVHVHRSFGL